MSASPEHAHDSDYDADVSITRKRTRISKACDHCSRRKMKCDGTSPQRPKCSNCTASGINCLFSPSTKRRGPPVKKSKTESPAAEAQRTALLESASIAGENKGEGDSDEEDDLEPLSEWLQKLHIDPMQNRQSATNASAWKNIRAAMIASPNWNTRRPQFWKVYPWEVEELSLYVDTMSRGQFNFPDADLLPKLIKNYFWDMGVATPLIHRPTFEKGVADGLHFRDAGFGAVLLLVSAIGSRYIDDPRVLLPSGELQSAGWKWYSQVRMVHKSSFTPPRVYDVQQYCLAAQFLVGCSTPHVIWHIVGQGLRVCVDVSANRGNVYRGTGYAQIVEEQWKRAFWTLVAMDRTASLEMGRPLSIFDEDIDAPMPRDCDDEYWIGERKDQYFVQPADKPTISSGFIHMIKIRRVQAYAMRTLFAVSRPKSEEWERRVIAELNTALDTWRSQLPAHLSDTTRCDPSTPFFPAAFFLHSLYHYTRIVIHRPFAIPPRQAAHPLGPAAREKCLDSARQIASMFAYVRDATRQSIGTSMLSAFTAASALFICGTVDDLPGVHICMGVIKDCERWSQLAGRYWDLLHILMSSINRTSSSSRASGSRTSAASSPAAYPYEGAQQQSDATPIPASATDVESSPGVPTGQYQSYAPYTGLPGSATEIGMRDVPGAGTYTSLGVGGVPEMGGGGTSTSSMDAWNPLIHEYEQLLGTMSMPVSMGPAGPVQEMGLAQTDTSTPSSFTDTSGAGHLPDASALTLTEDMIASWASGRGFGLDSWAGADNGFGQGLGGFEFGFDLPGPQGGL